MAKPSDLSSPTLKLNFFECRPHYNTRYDLSQGGKVPADEQGIVEVKIYNRYLYTFSASGGDFGINSKTPGWETRTFFGSGLQHMAPFGATANPKPSNAPKPSTVETETFFDENGRLWPLDISTTWKKPRHKRPHPKWEDEIPRDDRDASARDRDLRDRGLVGYDHLGVSLLDKQKQPKRFYFLLSPIRLGPKALQAALDNPDGLSLWYNSDRAEKEGKLVAPAAGDLKGRNWATVFVVDPYAFAANISEQVLETALFNYFSMIEGIKARNVPGVSPRHFDDSTNGGTIQDLHFIALILSQLKQGDPKIAKLVDDVRLDEIIGAYGQALASRGAACEAAGAFLGNWMSGPAHGIVDTCVVEDLEDPADPLAADDKGSALCYWSSQTSYLPALTTGAAFMRRVMVDGPAPNPIRDLLKRYVQPGKKLPEGSTDELAFQLASEVLADLILRWTCRIDASFTDASGFPDPEKAPEMALQISTITNNLGYFGVELGNEAKAKVMTPEEYALKTAKVDKHKVKGVIYVVGDGPAKIGSVTRNGKKVFDVSDRGWVADVFLRKRASRLTSGFTAEQVRRAAAGNSLGKHLQELTKKSNQIITDAERRVKELADREEAVRDSVRQIKRSDEYLATAKKIDAQINRLEEYSKDVRATANELRKKVRLEQSAWMRLRNTPLPTETVARDELLRKVTAADQNFVLGTNALKLQEEKLVGIETRISELKKDWSKATQRVRLIEAQIKEVRDTKNVAVDNLNVLKRQATIAKDLDEEADNFAAVRKQGLNAAKVFVAFASFAVEFTFLLRTYENPDAKLSEKAWAWGEVFKSSLDVTKDVMKVCGVKEADFAKYMAGLAEAPESVSKRQALAGYGRSLLKPGPAMGILAVVGVLAGAYTIAKYGATGIDAIKMDDTSVAIGAGIAMLGGVFTISSALGFGLTVGFTLTASGVGTLAGLLIVAGALIVAATADSEWEFFAEHCYFAKDDLLGYRNWRTMGKGADHYLGELQDPDSRKQDKGIVFPDCRWNTRSQRLVLERLLSRYSVSAQFGFHNWPDEANPGGLEWFSKPVTVAGTLLIDFQYLPPGAELDVEFVYGTETGPVTDKVWRLYHFHSDELNKGAVRKGKDLIGLFAPPAAGGWVCLILREDTMPCFNRLVARTHLTLPDATVVSGSHLLISRKLSASVSAAGNPLAAPADVTHTVWMEANSDPSFADQFSNATDPVFNG
jgi:hypothetical protein